MNTLSRRCPEFLQRIKIKFDDKVKEVNQKDKAQLELIKSIENEYDENLNEYESELASLKEKYFKKTESIIKKRKKEIERLSKDKDNVYFWFKVLLNSKGTNDLINENDYDILKHLIDIKWEYIDNDKRSFKLIFEFTKNEYFTNKSIEKEYHISKDELICKIISSEIKWNKDKDYFNKKKKKVLKNKKTGEIKEFEVKSAKNSFFNFFYNITIPNKEQLKNITAEEEKDISELLDKEYELGKEIKDEIIPHACEYYVGVIQDNEEYSNYIQKNLREFEL